MLQELHGECWGFWNIDCGSAEILFCVCWMFLLHWLWVLLDIVVPLQEVIHDKTVLYVKRRLEHWSKILPTLLLW